MTEKPTALLRWMVADPEMAWVVPEFIGMCLHLSVYLHTTGADTQTHHLEDTPGNLIIIIILLIHDNHALLSTMRP